MDKYLNNMQTRLLVNISDEVLTTVHPHDIAEEYFVSESTIRKECKFRGLTPYSHRRRWHNITLTYDEVMNNNYSRLAEKYEVSVPIIIKIAERSLNMSNLEIQKCRDELKGKLHTPVEELSDEELKKSVVHLRNKYKFSQHDIKRERERRAISAPNGRHRNEAVQNLTDDELFNNTMKSIVRKTNSSINTVSRERRRRREAGYNDK